MQVELDALPRTIEESEKHVSDLKAQKKTLKNTVLEDAEEVMPLLIDTKLQITEQNARISKIKRTSRSRRARFKSIKKRPRITLMILSV